MNWNTEHIPPLTSLNGKIRTTITSLDLAQIAASGQCFTWKQLSESRWAIPVADRCLIAEQHGENFMFFCSEAEWTSVWCPYFDLGRDYDILKAHVDPADAYLTAAVAYGGGIRILQQPLWEVLVSFLISQNNTITRITRSIDALCRTYGAPHHTHGYTYHAFPSPDALTAATASDFAALGLGYRAKYLSTLSQQMQGGHLAAFEKTLQQASDSEARARLMELYGIGPKVADCICLFALHRMDAFPLDTHIRKLLSEHYAEGFPAARYRGMLGAIQQYLFYYHLQKNG